MKISIGSNIASLVAQRRLNEASNKLSSVSARLSSGMRINSASDEAAGLAIADSLRAESRIASQAIRNLNDGLSLINVADAAITSLSDIVTRLKELAMQSANGTFGHKQRNALDLEAQALNKEYLRIIQGTKYNGKQVLSREFGDLTLQAGVGTNAVLQGGFGGTIGTGTFTHIVSSASSPISYNSDMTSGDLNGDGIIDLVSINVGGFAEVHIGNGDGTFARAVSYNGGGFGVTLSDLNNDGILDLGTASGGVTYVRLGRGDGTFQAEQSYLFESAARSIKFGDFNGDGKLDMVTSGYITGNRGHLEIRLGNGDGTFGQATSYLANRDNSREVEIADVNGDGILDLAVAGIESGGIAGVALFLGNGDGTFAAKVTIGMTGVWVRSLELVDINNDGNVDMVSAGIGTARIRLGNGDGTFGQVTSYATEPTSSLTVKVGDVNGDGFQDLVTSGYNGSNHGSFTVRLGDGTGSFGPAVSYTASGAITGKMFGLVLDDLNGDNVLDIATAGNFGAFGRNHIFLGNTTEGTAPLLPFSIATMSGARHAISIFQRKLDELANQRSQIGAFQSRVDVALNVLQASQINLQAAERRIRDADIAAEVSALIRLQILHKAGAAVLAQANQQPSIVLQLIREPAG